MKKCHIYTENEIKSYRPLINGLIKKIILILLTFISLGYSQTSKFCDENRITNSERYYIDYELKNIQNINSINLEELDINLIEIYRQEDIDVEVYNSLYNCIIILYSKNKVTYNKNSLFNSIKEK